jgi:hypothetical protein
MPLTALIFAILIAAGGLLDVWIGDSGDRKLKDRIVEYWVAAQQGDWTQLYRYPAGALLRFMDRLLGPRAFRMRYIVRTAVLSICLTAMFFILSMTVSYGHALLTEKRCPVPGIGQFLEIPAYMSTFLFYVALVNFAFDFFSWTATRWGLRVLSGGSGCHALMLAVAFPLFGAALLWSMYAIYLPLTIKVQANMEGIPFNWNAFLQIFRVNLKHIADFFSTPHYLFRIDCGTGRSIFGISFLSTMQILATETMIPVVLLLVSSVFGIAAYHTRRVTGPFIVQVLERLSDNASKHIFAVVGTLISLVYALLAAIVTYHKS